MFGYTGHQYDREIGLYYARARTYMPLLGRFMQVDPVGYKQSLNLYTYGMGNPMAGTDPSGGFFQFIVPLLQLAAGELSASAFAGLLVNYAINYAIDTAITMALEDAYPGAGQVLGIIRTVVGLATSAGFGGGQGKTVSAAGDNGGADYAGTGRADEWVEYGTANMEQIAMDGATKIRNTSFAGEFYERGMLVVPNDRGDGWSAAFYSGGPTKIDMPAHNDVQIYMHSHPNGRADRLSWHDMRNAAGYAKRAGIPEGEVWPHVYTLDEDYLYQFARPWNVPGIYESELMALDPNIPADLARLKEVIPPEWAKYTSRQALPPK